VRMSRLPTFTVLFQESPTQQGLILKRDFIIQAHCNTLQHTASQCNTLQYTAAHCSTLQHTATHCNILQHTATHCNSQQHTAAHSMSKEPYKNRAHSLKKPDNAWSLWKVATPLGTRKQHTALCLLIAFCIASMISFHSSRWRVDMCFETSLCISVLQVTATHCNILQHTATHCNVLQRTVTHCNTPQHASAHCNTLQHTAAHCNPLRPTASHCHTL